jgi:phage-related protein
VVEAFFLGFLIGATKFYISIKPAIKALADFFGFDDTSLADVLTIAKGAGELAFKAFLAGAVVFTLIAGAIAAVVAVAMGLVAVLAGALYITVKNVIVVLTGLWDLFKTLRPTLEQAWADFVEWGRETLRSAGETFDAVVAAVSEFAVAFPGRVSQAIAAAVEWFASLPGKALAVLSALGPMLLGLFTSAWATVMGFLSGVSLVDLGKQLIQGLASGITAGVGVVVNAVKNAVGGAIKAAKSALGIASPSKVFADIGVNTAEGFAGGVDTAAPAADAAVRDMLEPPVSAPVPALVTAASSAQAPTSTSSQASSSGGLNLAGAVFNFYGVEGAEDAESRFGELLTRIVEGDAAALGAAQGVT